MLPRAVGLYDPTFEHDACGTGFVADLGREPTHRIVELGLQVLTRMAHRGARGADPLTGDGAGILLQIPHAFYERAMGRKGKELPNPGDYGIAQTFLSRDAEKRAFQVRTLEDTVRYHNQRVIGWRDIPVEPLVLGPLGQSSQPVLRQLFIGRMCPLEVFERTLFMIRKRAGRLASGTGDFYIASASSRTVVYKALALPERLDAFYPDLASDDVTTSLALVHSRFSTNTFPTWERAHPYRYLAHNGEINTLRGNQTWMAAREALLASDAFAEHLADFTPIIRPGGSDSASLDNVVDFLVAGGRSLPHVMMMLVPEAWSEDREMSPAKRGFYEYHGGLVEPWDGPSAILFTDGVRIGAMLDRNGLRPGKFVVTHDGLVVCASEMGVVDVLPENVAEKGRLAPGKMLLVDTREGRIVPDDEIKHAVVSQKPYAEWVRANKIEIGALPAREAVPVLYPLTESQRSRSAKIFGYTREDLQVVLGPMAETGEEPTGSMGNDTPLAILSRRPRPLFRYFKQQFAQVTNPPIDPIRESLVMSLVSCVGGEKNLLGETPEQARLLELPHPILTATDLARLQATSALSVATLPMLFPSEGDAGTRLKEALDALATTAARAVDEGASILVLSDRGVSESLVPIPSLLGTAAVHHALIRSGRRMRTGLIVESGEPREVADIALLIGYGAGAVSPYLALEIVSALARSEKIAVHDARVAEARYIAALKKGLLKVLSKMGISTLSSYQGAQTFEAIGIGRGVVQRYFPGTASRIGGLELQDIAEAARGTHANANANAPSDESLEVGGVYAWRVEGEAHLWTPGSVASLQKAVRLSDRASYDDYAARINDQREQPFTLRGLWDLVPSRASVPLSEVEPASSIVRRFSTGAMSFGSISKEAHENLAVAMNRIGGKSNSGEGGEDSERFVRDATGDSRRSAIKQVASGRFGVTTHYLVHADEIQIKIAQGAKPGEGGQIPGPKVDLAIARVRHATPGVTLISPPPHHDIYSIEDLSQLIFDLKAVHPTARVSVKLVSEAGVGTVAAGVAKAHADAIHIAGHDGGTGASPLSSIHHAGSPWEIGLAEAQQVLMMNGLRGRVTLTVDGQLKTGRDVAFAALLGAEEYGFATAPLVASGCVMMRKCHLNTCPVGIATQDPVLRARFKGAPEHVINFFFFVAEELRELMAKLGFRRVEDMIGRAEHIVPRANAEPKAARLLDFTDVLFTVGDESGPRHGDGCVRERRDGPIDQAVLDGARLSLKYGEPSSIKVSLENHDRAAFARLAGEIARRYGAAGLPPGTVHIQASGTAGQSFGAFAVSGMLLVLEGDANDYVGKGLSGGVLAIYPPVRSTYRAHTNVIVGNTVLYGATSGRAFFAGCAGERFAVRNSGASTVVEGVGDHGCEYMTGGTVVVLGPTGRNFGAGMSGGVAYVLDDGTLPSRISTSDLVLSPLDDADVDVVSELLSEHIALTSSAWGKQVKERWGTTRARFVKVVPREYARILESRQASATASHG
jgi:glutamate synthase (NADPH/NADH) large chain